MATRRSGSRIDSPDRRLGPSQLGALGTAERRSIILSAVFTIPYCISLFAANRHDGYTTLWDGWMGPIASVLPAATIVLASRRNQLNRMAWRWIGAGIVLNAAANLWYVLYDQNLRPTPVPASSDVLYLLSYLSFIAGVAVLTQSSLGRGYLSVRLDGLVLGLTVGAVTAATSFGRILEVSGSPLAVATALAYPACDLVLIILIVASLAPHRYRLQRSAALLLGGISCFVVGDIIWMNQVATDSYIEGGPLEATWSIGIFLIGIAASVCQPAPPEEQTELTQRPTSHNPGLAMVPIVAGVVALIVLLVDSFRDIPLAATLLAIGALSAVILRTGLTVRELRASVDNYHAARTDALTGLANRRALLERLGPLFDATTDEQFAAILLIDLDGFKEVNDSIGHDAGDRLLQVVGARFQATLTRDECVLARLGGDEFACGFHVRSVTEAIAVARDLSAALGDPVALQGIQVRVGASIGVALSRVHGSTPVDVLRNADVAMYQAKRDQTDVVSYSPEFDLVGRDRLLLIAELRDAIEEHQLTLHFQPTFDVRTERIHGVEALVRWQHPSRGLMFPDDFIPLADRAGLIPQLTLGVLYQAIAEAARLATRGHELQMSVNITWHDLVNESFAERVDLMLQVFDVAPQRLTLEITESSLSKDTYRAHRGIEQLRSRGIRVSIDDFGVGYSSMSQLLGLSVDELKMDRSFVAALSSDHRAEPIIKCAIELARALNLSMVIEGVESATDLAAVTEFGTDLVQGHHIAMAMGSDDLGKFLEQSAVRQLDARASQASIQLPARLDNAVVRRASRNMFSSSPLVQ